MSQTFKTIQEREQALLCHSYGRYPLAIARGEGSRLWDVSGKQYVDLLAGIAVVGLGHCNEELNRVLEEQSRQLWHVSNLFYQRPQLDLADILLSTTHHSKAFFCNSGAEANEACIKLARRYMRTVRNREAYRIITLNDCFHGRTLATLAATGRPNLSEGFGPLPEGFTQIPAGDIDAMKAAATPDTAAVLLEVIQGEGGVKPLDAGYLHEVQQLCRDRGIVLMCDEVQCGLCRTGTFWGFQQYGIEPDAISVAKSLANGLPMGAMLATEELAKGFVPGSHATTFGGGGMTSAIAHKTVEIMLRDELAQRAGTVGTHTLESLRALQARMPDKIKDVRGMGLMIGVELADRGQAIWEELLDRGYITNLSHGTTLRLLPALTVPEEDLAGFVDTLGSILEKPVAR
jgi:acetylornithine aminotransferase